MRVFLFVCLLFFCFLFFPRGDRIDPVNFDLCLHIVMVTGKCADVFRGILGLRRES